MSAAFFSLLIAACPPSVQLHGPSDLTEALRAQLDRQGFGLKKGCPALRVNVSGTQSGLRLALNRTGKKPVRHNVSTVGVAAALIASWARPTRRPTLSRQGASAQTKKRPNRTERTARTQSKRGAKTADRRKSGANSAARTDSAARTNSADRRKSGANSGTKSGATSAARTNSGANSAARTNSGANSAARTNSGANSAARTNSGTKSGTNSAARTNSGTKSAARTNSGTNSAARTNSGTKSAARTNSGTNSAARTNSGANSAARTNSETKSGARANSGTKSGTPVDAGTGRGASPFRRGVQPPATGPLAAESSPNRTATPDTPAIPTAHRRSDRAGFTPAPARSSQKAAKSQDEPEPRARTENEQPNSSPDNTQRESAGIQVAPPPKQTTEKRPPKSEPGSDDPVSTNSATRSSNSPANSGRASATSPSDSEPHFGKYAVEAEAVQAPASSVRSAPVERLETTKAPLDGRADSLRSALRVTGRAVVAHDLDVGFWTGGATEVGLHTRWGRPSVGARGLFAISTTAGTTRRTRLALVAGYAYPWRVGPLNLAAGFVAGAVWSRSERADADAAPVIVDGFTASEWSPTAGLRAEMGISLGAVRLELGLAGQADPLAGEGPRPEYARQIAPERGEQFALQERPTWLVSLDLGVTWQTP